MAQDKTGKVVIMTVNDFHARIDRLSLKKMRILAHETFASGADGLSYIRDYINDFQYKIDFVLCDWALSDMDTCQFIRQVRKDRATASVPVVVVTFQNRKDAVLDAIAAGCTGYVLRPYSQETFERHITLAKQTASYGEVEEEQLRNGQDLVNQGSFDAAIDEFEEVVAIKESAQRYFDMGNRYLLEEQYGKAIVAFNKALRINDLFVEAYKGLAAAYRGKGDLERHQQYLSMAGEMFAAMDRLQDARDVFVEIIKQDAQAPNPYNTLGIRLRKKGDLGGAIHAYRQALTLMPEDEGILFNMAKALSLAGDDKAAEAVISQALKLRSDFYEGLLLYDRLTGHPWPDAPLHLELGAAGRGGVKRAAIDEE